MAAANPLPDIPKITKPDPLHYHKTRAVILAFMSLHLDKQVRKAVVGEYTRDCGKKSVDYRGRPFGAFLMLYADKVVTEQHQHYKLIHDEFFNAIPDTLASDAAQTKYVAAVEEYLGKVSTAIGFPAEKLFVILAVTSAMVNRSLSNRNAQRAVEVTDWLTEVLEPALDNKYYAYHMQTPFWNGLEKGKKNLFAVEIAAASGKQAPAAAAAATQGPPLTSLLKTLIPSGAATAGAPNISAFQLPSGDIITKSVPAAAAGSGGAAASSGGAAASSGGAAVSSGGAAASSSGAAASSGGAAASSGGAAASSGGTAASSASSASAGVGKIIKAPAAKQSNFPPTASYGGSAASSGADGSGNAGASSGNAGANSGSGAQAASAATPNVLPVGANVNLSPAGAAADSGATGLKRKAGLTSPERKKPPPATAGPTAGAGTAAGAGPTAGAGTVAGAGLTAGASASTGAGLTAGTSASAGAGHTVGASASAGAGQPQASAAPIVGYQINLTTEIEIADHIFELQETLGISAVDDGDVDEQLFDDIQEAIPYADGYGRTLDIPKAYQDAVRKYEEDNP